MLQQYGPVFSTMALWGNWWMIYKNYYNILVLFGIYYFTVVAIEFDESVTSAFQIIGLAIFLTAVLLMIRTQGVTGEGHRWERRWVLLSASLTSLFVLVLAPITETLIGNVFIALSVGSGVLAIASFVPLAVLLFFDEIVEE
jgi:hypothetical protein